MAKLGPGVLFGVSWSEVSLVLGPAKAYKEVKGD